MIAIIDYGMGNIHSVRKALEILGAETKVTNNPKDIRSCEKLVLPGVGAFGDALADMEKQGLIKAIEGHIKDKKVFLGICLGMHLLFSSSEESKEAKGLKVLEGSVKKFSADAGLKIPHMGWNQIRAKNKDCPLLENIADNSYVYFCHSYYSVVSDEKIIAASTDYGVNFSSVLWKDNIYALQFHPEKSQAVGLKILENFVNLC